MTDVIRRLNYLLTTDSESLQRTEFLLAKLRIARAKLPRQVPLDAADKAELLKFGKPLGTAVKGLLVLVTPRTFQNWVNAELKTPDELPATGTKGGRPRIKQDVRETIVRLAKENGWGYERIRGELHKLHIRASRTTIINILKEKGFDRGPDRNEGTWFEFLKREAATLYACDFFSTKVWTALGQVEFFVLFFIHVSSRRVHVAGRSANPNAAWVAQQARNACMFFAEQPEKPKYLLRNNDGKFQKAFDTVFEAEKIDVIRVGPRAPNINAYAERWVQSVRRECLDHFMILGEAHLRHLITEFTTYYNLERPHQGLGNVLLTGQSATLSDGAVECSERLGGLLKHYHRKAA
jgi:putative transposase